MFPRLGHGFGLRPPHYRQVIDEQPPIGWLELVTENFLVAGGPPRRVLEAARARYPVVLHGVSLSIGSTDPLDERYLDALAGLVAEIEPAMVSDHLCWTSFGGHAAHDLWPLPYTDESLALVVERVARVQDRLRRRILLENPASYVTFVSSRLEEPDFLAEVARRADCGIVLDLGNLHVSAANHGFEARDYLAPIPPERVGYFHLAGHDADGGLLLDTHDAPVCQPVLDLYREALRRFGPVSTLIEWDGEIPPLEGLIAEVDRARAVADAALEETASGS